MNGLIVIVDDNPALLRHLARCLEADGFGVAVAGSREQAEPYLGASGVCAFVLDVGLPDGDGLEILQDIRRRCPDMIVVVMSASDMPGLRERALGLGAREFLAKPFPLGGLRQALGPACQPGLSAASVNKASSEVPRRREPKRQESCLHPLASPASRGAC